MGSFVVNVKLIKVIFIKMPAIVENQFLLPENIEVMLSKLDAEFEEGDITLKGYCKRKWNLLQEHAPLKVTDDYEELQRKFNSKQITEDELYQNVNEVLKELDLNKHNTSGLKTIENKKRKLENTDTTHRVSENAKKISVKTDLKEFKNACSNSDSCKMDVENGKSKPDSENLDPTEENLNQKQNSNYDSPVPGPSRIKNEIEQNKTESFFSNNNGCNDKNSNELPASINNAEENKKPKQVNTIEASFERQEKRKADQSVNNKNLNDEKKIKLEEDESTKKNSSKIITDLKNTPAESLERCKICKQRLNNPDLIIYPGHPNNAIEEYVALIDPRLLLFTGEEQHIDNDDVRPQVKLTLWSVYDKEGHLCRFEAGLIERNVDLYFSGYIKPVYEDDPSKEQGIPAKDLGPINEWWIAGYDGGEKALLGFSTAYAEYYLMEPSEEYRPLFMSVREKIYLSKRVIEFLFDESLNQPSYEDLLNNLESLPAPETGAINEDCLLRHAQFVCDQVNNIDLLADPDEELFITTSCMRALVKLAGVTFGKRKALRRTEQKTDRKQKKPLWTKATTTNLVREVFETFFIDQLDKSQQLQVVKRKRCGVCEACQTPDCGQCSSCTNMAKFGGKGKAKKACKSRRCPNLAIEEVGESESEGEETCEKYATVNVGEVKKARQTSDVAGKKVEWISDYVTKSPGRVYYSMASVGGEEVKPGDYVMLESEEPGQPLLIAKIGYMWEDDLGSRKMFHAHYFMRGTDTVLGETSDPRELFQIDQCEHVALATIVRLAVVEYRKPSENWFLNGGLDELPPRLEDNGKNFYYQKRYDPELSRFEDPIEQDAKDMEGFKPCLACQRTKAIKSEQVPKLREQLDNGTWKILEWRKQIFTINTGVYLLPDAFTFETSCPLSPDKKQKKDEYDPEIYPEFYRKTDSVRGSNFETDQPFCIGMIKQIVCEDSIDNLIKEKSIKLKVYKMYRPENTHKGASLAQQLDLNLLYWSDEVVEVTLDEIRGRCNIVFSDAVDISMKDWMNLGPNRFYFSQAYCCSKRKFQDVPSNICTVGRKGKGKGKGKGKKSEQIQETDKFEDDLYLPVTRPLRSLDVFAGCGGLSEGLRQAGVAESKWAIEKEAPAAHAFKLNNSSATVFSEDCNELLRLALDGQETNSRNQKIPKRGDVELLCGGPPCQGYSSMNRFNAGQYSLFKNSLIVSYLSYCDFYRPKFFIFENVRNFVAFKRGVVLKLTLRCLLAMGYQCTFGVLQAGNYGVPQTRRRLIILAAAPGEKLPFYPEPTHVFSKRACQLSVVIDDKKYGTNVSWLESAPLRTITVRDAMSDLPQIRNGHKQEEMAYDSDPVSHFQRMLRSDQYQHLLKDHVCKEMSPLTEARMSFIPTAPGSDWRDLPNIVTRLSDGTSTRKLVYTHRDGSGKYRGVCACAEGKPCDPQDRQDRTLIPWCLPHTASRHNNWAGLYGRLEWDGYFSTTVTNPEPMGKQGRVLHPTQNRVVSVRECARSQGFPDTFRFFGNIVDKHRQVGNAVPPPMARQIGFEIRKCITKKS